MAVFPPHILQLAQCPSPGTVLRTWSTYAQETLSSPLPTPEFEAVSIVTKKLTSVPSIGKGVGTLLGSTRREQVRIGYAALMSLAEEMPTDPLIAGLARAIQIELPLPCADRVKAAMKNHLDDWPSVPPRRIRDIFEEYKIDIMDMEAVKIVVDLIGQNVEGADMESLRGMFCFLDGFDGSVRGTSEELTGAFPPPLRDRFSALRLKLLARLLKDYNTFMQDDLKPGTHTSMHEYDEYQSNTCARVELFRRACLTRDSWENFRDRYFHGRTLGQIAVRKIEAIIEILEKETSP